MKRQPTDMKLDDLYDPQRVAQVEQRQRNAFGWHPQNYIPLGLWVVNPDHARQLDYRQWLEPAPFLEFQKHVLFDSLSVGSDLLPVIGINHFGTAVLNTMFGAEIFMPDRAIATLQDNGPTPMAVLENIQQVDELNEPRLDAGMMPQVESFCRYYRTHLPNWVRIGTPLPNGPFSCAMELRGSDFLIDLVDDPPRARRLINLVAEAKVKAEHHLRHVLGEPMDRFWSNFGIAGPGLRLGDDSICFLSSHMIQQFALAGIAAVNRLTRGTGYVHFCSLSQSRFEQIYPTFLNTPAVRVISSQLAFEYYSEHLEELRGRLAVESLYAPGHTYVCEKYGSFANWADEFVPRFKNESGLVLYFQVSTVEEGREIWSDWQRAHRI
ncbi:MAG: hypothetical protein QGH33_10750 [Pirellulaceae bacterium]|nr:hypothetical protein [Pirellulaceae bacterium]